MILAQQNVGEALSAGDSALKSLQDFLWSADSWKAWMTFLALVLALLFLFHGWGPLDRRRKE